MASSKNLPRGGRRSSSDKRSPPAHANSHRPPTSHADFLSLGCGSSKPAGKRSVKGKGGI